MTDSSEAELPPQTNGVSDGLDEDDRAKIRPVDIDADVKEMERRKRVEIIMNSKMFREELERIIETQLRDGSGTTGLMQQISDMMGVSKQAGNVFKNSSCVVPINDIRGVEAMGYGKGEKILRCKLAAVFRLIDLYGWSQGSSTIVTARLNQDDEHFLVNPYGMMFHEITASSLIKVDMQGNVVEQGTTNFSVNIAAFSLHAAVHAARPDIKCIINVHTPSVVAVSAIKHGILPLSQESVVIGEISSHTYLGGLLDPEEKDKLARNLGPINKVLLLTNRGALCCGDTIEESFFNSRNIVLASESQLKLMPIGLDNLILLNDETRKQMYDAAHKAPESSPRPDQPSILEGKVERKWRVGGVEFEALMRMLDNAGFRTGYIYRHPLVKGDPPKPKNDVEVPPAVSSLGYLLEEEELYRQGLWRKLEGGRKGHDRSRWLNSPNVYQKVEILETGTPDPKKITKWVAEASPSHSSTPVKIDAALQFVPKGTNPKEFKQKQQQIKDYRRADKISAGPQSHILEGVTWEEARKMQDATVTQTGDQVVLMGAASKGIIQRGHQHNAMVYKSPYAKNPFDSITDEELDEYKRVVEKKVKGEYDTDYSESEGLSSGQNNRRVDYRSPTSETEEESRDEPRVLRIETKQAPRPSQPEVVLSDGVYLVRDKQNARFKQSHYRTNNFLGLPKGSYCIPNPQHFHVVHEKQIAKPARPCLLRVGPQRHASHYIFNRFKINCDRSSQTVTLNIGNVRTVSLDMSLQTVTDFIYPLANALNMLNLPSLNNQECQTSYIINGENCDEEKTDEEEHDHVDSIQNHVETSTDEFEKQILQKLQDNLIADLTNSDSDSDSMSAWDVSENESEQKVSSVCENNRIDFGEGDAVTVNESTADVCNLNMSSTSSASNTSSRRNLLEDFNNFVDEGICDLSSKVSPPIKKTIQLDDNIRKLGDEIYQFMNEAGFEDAELLIFPEILHDTHSEKFFTELLKVYQRMFSNALTNAQLDDLRSNLTSYIVQLMETSDGSNLGDSFNSDKMFSFSENLCSILDHFFHLVDERLSILPLDGFPPATAIKAKMDDYEVLEEITTFKKDRTSTGNESYWFTLMGTPPSAKKPVVNQTRNKIVNIDDIPLPLPKDTYYSDSMLPPYAEEANRNLPYNFQEPQAETVDFLAGGDNKALETILMNNNADSYVAFEKPETNVVVCNGVSFYRTVTTNVTSFVKSDGVIFNKQDECEGGDGGSRNSLNAADKNIDANNISGDEYEGDWMGYEKAKF